ncbi:NHL repeat-containing protein [Candidatus Binatus sp.]|uniref:NHL repeat-containing protein n=1 Tax=Candidatus Binatus sp. TaxID=2811406 RepID=UPI003BB04887
MGLRNSVNVYPLNADGDLRPSATIKGAATGLDWAKSIAVDSSGKIYVLNGEGGAEYTGTVEVFAPGSTGNVAPIARIAGANTGLRSVNDIAVDSAGNIYVAIEGVGVGNIPPGILVYPPGSNGNVRPSVTIGGSQTRIQNPYGVAVDSKGNLYVAESATRDMGRVLVFPPGSKGNVKPSFVIEGPDTAQFDPIAIALDSDRNLYVANRGRTNGIAIFKLDRDGRPASEAGLDGPTPSARISGPRAGLMDYNYSIPGIAVDSGKNIFVTFQGGRYNETNKVVIFAAGSNGDVAPRAVISGYHTKLSGPDGIAIGPYSGASLK